MNSFDFFDTLVARRSVVDKRFGPEEEKANLFPIKEIVDMVKPEDIIISDYDYPEVVQWGVKNVCGLNNEVVVTQDGKLTGSIWTKYKPIIHFGDNVAKDVDSPRMAGIEGRYVGHSLYTAKENTLIKNGWERLAKCTREARLRTFNPEQRKAELLQIELNFPFLVAASILVEQEMEKTDTRQLLMCSRDCNLWAVLLNKIVGKRFDIRYFYTSRVARNSPSASYLDYVNSLVPGYTAVVDLCGYGESLPKLLDKTPYAKTTPIWILCKYGHPEQNRSKGILSVADSYIERLNVAMYPKVIDVLPGGHLVFSNPANINWQSPRIAAMHSAFLMAVKTLDNYGVEWYNELKAKDLAYSMLDQIAQNRTDVLEEDVIMQEAHCGE